MLSARVTSRIASSRVLTARSVEESVRHRYLNSSVSAVRHATPAIHPTADGRTSVTDHPSRQGIPSVHTTRYMGTSTDGDTDKKKEVQKDNVKAAPEKESAWASFLASLRPPPAPSKVNEEKRDIKRSLRHCYELAYPHRYRLVRAGGYLVISSASMMALPWAVGQMVDIMNAPDSEAQLYQLYAFLGPVFVGGAAAGFLRARELTIVGESVTRTLRERLFKSIMQKPTGFFDQHKTGDLVSRLSNDTNNIGHTMSERLASGVRAFFQGVGGLSYMLYMSPSLTAYMLATVAPIMLSIFSYGRVVKRLAESIQSSLGASSTLAAERLANIRTVRVFGQEENETSSYNNEVKNIFEAARYQGILQGAMITIFPMIGNFGVIFIMHQGAGLVSLGTMSTGDLISFITYSVWLGVSIRNLTAFFTDTVRSLGASERAFDILDMPSFEWSGTYKPEHIKGHFSLENIRFAYPTRDHTPVLSDFSLDIRPGQTIAIVGESGSGKSTVAHLLAGLYEASAGTVTLDGTPIHDYDRDTYLRNIGVVSQEPVLFSGTIASNIRYGAPEGSITDAMMHDAARKASAHSFILSLPDGYDTVVGERGYTLSGGQKQRLAIARALARRPVLLILDEATSALDSESEHLVQVAMHDMMLAASEQTMVVIAHRLSTIQNADVIAVLNQGSVAEVGTFDELLERNGLFANLVQHQYSVRSDPTKMDLQTDTYV